MLWDPDAMMDDVVKPSHVDSFRENVCFCVVPLYI